MAPKGAPHDENLYRMAGITRGPTFSPEIGFESNRMRITQRTRAALQA